MVSSPCVDHLKHQPLAMPSQHECSSEGIPYWHEQVWDSPSDASALTYHPAERVLSPMQHALLSHCNTSENWGTVCSDYPMHGFVPCSCHGWVTLDQGGHVLDFIWPCYVAKALVLDLDFAQLLDSTALLIQIFCL